MNGIKNTGTLDVNGLKIENFKNGDLGIHLQEKKQANIVVVSEIVIVLEYILLQE